jgi:hypothetical protein
MHGTTVDAHVIGADADGRAEGEDDGEREDPRVLCMALKTSGLINFANADATATATAQPQLMSWC